MKAIYIGFLAVLALPVAYTVTCEIVILACRLGAR